MPGGVGLLFTIATTTLGILVPFMTREIPHVKKVNDARNENKQTNLMRNKNNEQVEVRNDFRTNILSGTVQKYFKHVENEKRSMVPTPITLKAI